MFFFKYLAAIPVAALILSSCSTTPKITSQFNEPESPLSPEADLVEELQESEQHRFDGMAYHVTHDNTHLYILVDVTSARYFQLAREFGFTLYIDGEDDFSRSFGVTYPSGVFSELADYPGAQQGYLENPNWEHHPENESIMEAAYANMNERALLVQRSGRRDNMHAMPIPVTQLQAQNLFIEMDEDTQRGRIAFAIPLEVSATSQFSPEIKTDEIFEIGFEIDPVRLFDLDTSGAMPLTSSQTAAGGQQHDMGADEDQYDMVDLMRQRTGDALSEWVRIELE